MATNPNEGRTIAGQAIDVAEPTTGDNEQADSDHSVSSLFCHCGGLRLPGKEWECQACGDRSADPTVEMTLTDTQEVRELSVVTETYFIGPKTSVNCPTCGHGKAHYMLKQTRSADESETRFFTCPECEHEWRDHD